MLELEEQFPLQETSPHFQLSELEEQFSSSKNITTISENFYCIWHNYFEKIAIETWKATIKS